MLGILENTTVKFSPKFEQKKIRHNFLSIGGLDPPLLYPRFRRGLCPLHPLQGLPLPWPGWKTIDWNSSQLVLVYYWLMFWMQSDFWIFEKKFAPFFKQISHASFFMIPTIFWHFIHCEEETEFCSKNFPCPKNFLFTKLITFFGKVKNRFFFTNVFFHDFKYFLG